MEEEGGTDAAESTVEGEREPSGASSKETGVSRKWSRYNALILIAIFLLTAFAPPPWNGFAPLLFLVPVIYSIMDRIRKSSSVPGESPASTFASGDPRETSAKEPYSYVPKDPKDPRRYKPIG